MSVFFTHCLYAVLIILFVNATTQDGMIFGFVRKGLYFLPVWIKKPLYDCLVCMSPWYAFAIWFLLGGRMEFELVHFVLIVGGLNALLVIIIGDDELRGNI